MSDMKRLKTDASATTGELRAFIRGLKGRSPQEVMGIVAGNALTQGMVTATIGCVVMLAVLTVPFAFGSAKNKAKSKPVAASAESEVTKDDATSTKSATANGDTPSEEDLKRASKAMGLDETKSADPKKNPLDSFDNLLDKVK